MIMFSSFFKSKKWALWAYLGLFLLLFFLYIQTSLNVAINSWYSDFYNVLQKPKIELLDSNSTQKIETNFENNATLIQEANQRAEQNFQKANFINKGALYYYQNLLEYFFNSRAMIEKPNYSANDFYALILVFLAIAIPYVLIATINIYFASVYAFKWREAMTFSYLKFWKNKDDNIEGSSQRIQEDTYNFSKIVESLGLSFIKALMTLVAFIPILWSLSDVVSKALFANLSENSSFYFLKNIDGLLVYIALLISLGGLVVSWFVGIKLPGLEYNNQKAEAAFRKELVYAEDNRKEYAKNETMIELFTGLKFNYKRLFLHYGYFNIWLILFEQMIVIVPFLIMAPGLFAGAIGLGIVMQINNAFDQVRSSFSVFITNWTTITQLRSIYKRLKEFEKNISYKS
ncbi:putative transporter [Campylobacter jejuni]|uniref:putative transporter n=1 Tax=unclassified Campylobacter TaxID=2593542 RepID=UPI0009F36BBB|nr:MULTISPECIES: putative transporter [unclassified Campylobacter]ECL2827552.1 putative transporter [Campylobacter jejuni]ECL4319102.1 putative transporter [Campylobacter jejuni]ECL9474621.1 putative transporter [Campylobacter jejuni]EGD0208083.1 putative transporter [Campylobacter jejuni]HAA1510464.1 transporter [Campylobacter jejuni]